MVASIEKINMVIKWAMERVNQKLEILRPDLVVIIPAPLKLRGTMLEKVKFESTKNRLDSLEEWDYEIVNLKPGIITKLYFNKLENYIHFQVERLKDNKVLTFYRIDTSKEIEFPNDHLKDFLMAVLNVYNSLENTEKNFIKTEI